MITINKVELENFCQHSHVVETLSKGTNGIVGKNGAGKTNFIQAIFTGLTGTVQLDTIEENIQHGRQNATVVVTFTADGTPCKVKRVFYRSSPNTAKIWIGDVEGKPTATGIKKVNALMETLLNTDLSVLSEHIFIPQDKINSIIFESPTKRLKNFISMIPVIGTSEAKRNQINYELSKFPVVELPYDPELLSTSQASITAEVLDLTNQITAKQTAVSKIDYESVCDRLNKHTTARALMSSISEEPNKDKLKELEDKLTATIDEAAGAEATLSVMGDSIEKVVKQITDYEAYKDIPEKIQTIEDRLVDVAREHKKAIELVMNSKTDVQEDSVKELEKEIAVLEAERTPINNRYTTYYQALEEGKTSSICDSCGNEVTNLQEAVQELQVQDAVLGNTLQEKFQELKEQSKRLGNMKESLELAKSDERRLGNEDELLRSQLAGFPPDPGVTVAEYGAALGFVDLYEKTLERRTKADTDQKILEVQVESLRKEVEKYEKEQERRIAIVSDLLSDAEQEELTNLQTEYNTKKASLATDQAVLEAKSQELGRISSQLEEVTKIQEKQRKTQEYRDLLKKAYDVLHKDRLPKRVLQHYLSVLRVSVDHYLDVFGKPFSVDIDDDLDMIIHLPNGEKMGVSRLSGGQRSVLSLAFRFAIADLFCQGVGVLVLDEPTAAMDKDNIGFLSRLIDNIQAYFSSHNAQLLVVTHHASEMAGAFNKIIKIG